MKGRPLQKFHNLYENDSADASDDEQDQAAQSQEQEQYETQDEDDDDEEEEEESVYNKIHANLNTPVTSGISILRSRHRMIYVKALTEYIQI